MTVKEVGPPWELGRPLRLSTLIWRFKNMTSLAEAESKYGDVVQSAGGQIFGIEKAASGGRQEEKLTIGTPDGFIKIDVALNQPGIDAVLRERTAGVVEHARDLRTPSPPALASFWPTASARKKQTAQSTFGSRAVAARQSPAAGLGSARGLADRTWF